MISVNELDNLCQDRLDDAKALYNAGRYDGAYYVCGYVVELWLKKKICTTLGWQGYPQTAAEFKGLSSFKIHDLEMLLHLSGAELEVKSKHVSAWSLVNAWDSEIRYSLRKQTQETASNILIASEQLMKIV